MGVADRTLKTFDYISKGLLPLDDSLLVAKKRRLEEQILDCCVREEWEAGVTGGRCEMAG